MPKMKNANFSLISWPICVNLRCFLASFKRGTRCSSLFSIILSISKVIGWVWVKWPITWKYQYLHQFYSYQDVWGTHSGRFLMYNNVPHSPIKYFKWFTSYKPDMASISQNRKMRISQSIPNGFLRSKWWPPLILWVLFSPRRREAYL